MNRIITLAAISGIMAAATSLGAVLSNGGTLDQTAIITTVIAFILHAGKEVKSSMTKDTK